MTLDRIIKLLNAAALADFINPAEEITEACGADLMSDVLRFSSGSGLLITGLTNVHAIRTAEISGISCIVFVSGKIPSQEVISEAAELGIVLLSTAYALFEACGILYTEGLKNSSLTEKVRPESEDKFSV